MSKRNTIIYWVATLWLALGMVSTGIVQFVKSKEQMEMIARLGYPTYFLTLLAIWKFLGVIAILLPKSALVKEWAYAGFFFAMSGAIVSHLATGDEIKEIFGPSLLLLLTIVSWYFRPTGRKLALS